MVTTFLVKTTSIDTSFFALRMSLKLMNASVEWKKGRLLIFYSWFRIICDAV